MTRHHRGLFALLGALACSCLALWSPAHAEAPAAAAAGAAAVATGLSLLAVFWSAAISRLRVAASIAVFLSSTVLLFGTVRGARLRSGFDRTQKAEMEQAARVLRGRFSSALEQLDAEARSLAADARGLPVGDGRSVRFGGASGVPPAHISSREMARRVGSIMPGCSVALYDIDAGLLSWTGDLAPLAPSNLPQSRAAFIVKGARRSALYRAVSVEGTGLTVVSGMRLEERSLISGIRVPVNLSFIDSVETTSELENRFAGAPDSWKNTADGATLYALVRGPDSASPPLALATLRPRTLESAAASLDLRVRRASTVALAAAILLAWVEMFRGVLRTAASGRRAAWCLLGAVTLCGAFRAVMLAFFQDHPALRPSSFLPARFASARFWGLLASPADTAVTAGAGLAIILAVWGLLVRRGCPAFPRFVRAALSLFGPTLMLTAVLRFQWLLSEFSRNTDMDLLDFSILSGSVSTLCVRFGLVLLYGLLIGSSALLFLPLIESMRHGRLPGDAWLFVAGWAVLPLSIRWLPAFAAPYPRSDAVPAFPILLMALTPLAAAWIGFSLLINRRKVHEWTAAALLAAAALYLSVLAHQTAARRSLVADTVKPIVASQHSVRRFLLQNVLRSISNQSVERLPQADPAELAFTLWEASPFSKEGYASSIEIDDASGRALSRYSFDLPFEPAGAMDREGGSSGAITQQALIIGERRVDVLRGAKRIDLGGERGQATVEVRLSEGFDDLPFFRTPGRLNPLMLGPPGTAWRSTTPLFLLVFDAEGNRIFASSPEAAELRFGGTALPPDDRWVGLRRTEMYVFKDTERAYAIGFFRKTALEHTANCLNLLIVFIVLGLAARILLLAGGGAISNVSPARFLAMVTSRFSRKLFVTLIAVSVVPMVLLSFYLKRYVFTSQVRETEDRTAASLETARSILESYLATFREPPAQALGRVDDSLLIWVSELIQADLSLHRGPALAATSVRGLFLTDMLPTTLDGLAYEAVFVDKRPSVIVRRTMNGLLILEMSAPILVGRGGPAGALTLSATLGEEVIGRETAAFNRVLFVLGALFATASFAASYSLARRISGPIRRLTLATQEIARGKFGLRLDVASRDELRSLVHSFNLMAGNIKKREDELRLEKETIERIVRHATTGVVALDDTGRVTTINSAAAAMLGLETDRVLGRDFVDLLRTAAELQPLTERLALPARPARPRPGRDDDAEGGIEVRFHRGGEDRTLRVMVIPIGGANEPGIPETTLILLEDVTEILRSEKLKAWAELSRKVAHEIKNPLTPIRLAADHVRMVARRGDKELPRVVDTCTETILKQVETLRRLSTEFLSLAPERPLARQWTATADFVAQTLAPYVDPPPQGIRIVVETEAGTPDVHIDREILRRALVNLVENSIQALPEGGRIGVHAGPASDSSRSWVRIAVQDTGPGVKEEVRRRLFEPYFSTKSTGTGLGLAIARKIVVDHGGTLRLEPSDEPGTTFAMLLPAGEGS